MIAFFDRSVGVTLPRLLLQLELDKIGIGIEYHQDHYEMDEPDDIWLPKVGKNGWFVIGHDHSYHLNLTEREAIERYQIGCFYLWGNEAPLWETLRAFLRAVERIKHAAETLDRPFLRYVDKNGSLKERHP